MCDAAVLEFGSAVDRSFEGSGGFKVGRDWNEDRISRKLSGRMEGSEAKDYVKG